MAKRGRGLLSGCLVTLAFVVLGPTASASAQCAGFVGDPAPGYSGSVSGIQCEYEDGTPQSWTVPLDVTTASFSVRGADDASGAGGGHIEARLALVPGETLTFEPGANGEATDVKSEPPGGPFHLVVNGAPVRSDGQVSVEWGSITKDPFTTEVRARGWKVTRGIGRRTVALAWPVQRCVGLPEPELSDVEVKWGKRRPNGKFPAVIKLVVSSTSSPSSPCAQTGMSKRIKLARPLSKVILFDGSSTPAARERIPDHYSPLHLR